MRVMPMEEQCSALSWDVLVGSPLNGFQGSILADAWVADDSALGRGDQREGDCGCQHPTTTAACTRWAPANLRKRASRDNGVSVVIKGAVAVVATSAGDVCPVLPTTPSALVAVMGKVRWPQVRRLQRWFFPISCSAPADAASGSRAPSVRLQTVSSAPSSCERIAPSAIIVGASETRAFRHFLSR